MSDYQPDEADVEAGSAAYKHVLMSGEAARRATVEGVEAWDYAIAEAVLRAVLPAFEARIRKQWDEGAGEWATIDPHGATAYERRVAAQALRDAADLLPPDTVHQSDCDYRIWLLHRADQIEASGTGLGMREHDREVAEQALRDAADRFAAVVIPHDNPEWWRGYAAARDDILYCLRSPKMTDQIEASGEGEHDG